MEYFCEVIELPMLFHVNKTYIIKEKSCINIFKNSIIQCDFWLEYLSQADVERFNNFFLFYISFLNNYVWDLHISGGMAVKAHLRVL